jgi:pimeloyl-ACP methyl ester carboxylesterase
MLSVRAKVIAVLVATALGGAVDLGAQGAGEAIVPFKIAVSDAVLTDLKDRLARTRFPDEIENSGWDYGTNLAYLRELVTYWRTSFDWRAQERRLNQMPQFKTRIDGLDIHFVHQRSTHTDALPLVFVHGWPGSIVEVTKIIGPLTEPTKHGGRAEDAFHVVALSLPGYGFSERPKQGGVSNRRIAGIIAQLMARLGYERYGAQGGDWGGFIVRQLGLADPTHVIGVHSNMCVANPPPGGDPNAGVPAEEMKRVEAARARTTNETAYSQLHGTKPQTLGYSLNDSPAGLAAWIVEKFLTWSDSGGNVETKFTKDELLTNITIYWVTETGPSSTRLYYENRRDPGLQGRVEVPSACAVFPREMFLNAPRQWVEASYNLVQYTMMPRGGHFAAMEEPQLLVEDMRKFFAGLRPRR